MKSRLALSVLFVLIAATTFARVGYTSTGRYSRPHPKPDCFKIRCCHAIPL